MGQGSCPQRCPPAGHGTTSACWPISRQAAERGELRQLALDTIHWSTTVRYPADGMAYVVSPRTHPDHTEEIRIDQPAVIDVSVFTLLFEKVARGVDGYAGSLEVLVL